MYDTKDRVELVKNGVRRLRRSSLSKKSCCLAAGLFLSSQ